MANEITTTTITASTINESQQILITPYHSAVTFDMNALPQYLQLWMPWHKRLRVALQLLFFRRVRIS